MIDGEVHAAHCRMSNKRQNSDARLHAETRKIVDRKQMKLSRAALYNHHATTNCFRIEGQVAFRGGSVCCPAQYGGLLCKLKKTKSQIKFRLSCTLERMRHVCLGSLGFRTGKPARPPGPVSGGARRGQTSKGTPSASDLGLLLIS